MNKKYYPVKNSGIYAIKNMANGKYYIGSSKNLWNRKVIHFSLLRKNKHANPHLQNSWNKYGEQNFKFYILAYTSIFEKDLEEKEKFYIKYFNSTNRLCGYNLQDVNRFYLDEEVRKKISNTLKEYYKTHVNANKGKKPTHPPWNKGIIDINSKYRILKRNRSKFGSKEHWDKISKWHKENPLKHSKDGRFTGEYKK